MQNATLIIFLALLLIVPIFLVYISKRVPINTAMVIKNQRTQMQTVSFTRATVFPLFNSYEFVSLSMHTIELQFKDAHSIRCKDFLRADISLAVYVSLPQDKEGILKAVQALGIAQLNDPQAIRKYLLPYMTEAVQTICSQFDFAELFEKRPAVRDALLIYICSNLPVYSVEDVCIDFIEQTSKDALNPDDALDAQALVKIAQCRAEYLMKAQKIKHEEKLAIKKRFLDTRQAIYQLEQSAAKAQADYLKEISAQESSANTQETGE